MKNPCVAHRGWSGAAPENTVAAIGKALDHPGIAMIEIDVHLSKDSVPVVIHDDTLERTTNGTGRVGDYTYAELRQLDAGSWFAPEFAYARIPSLEEVLVVCRGKKRLNLELKQAADHYRGLEEEVVKLLRRHDMQEQVVVTSFDHLSVKRVKHLAPDLTVGPILHGLPVLLGEQLAELEAGIMALAYPYMTTDLARDLAERGVEVIAWTMDDRETMRRIARLHETIQICTNHPDRWFAVATARTE